MLLASLHSDDSGLLRFLEGVGYPLDRWQQALSAALASYRGGNIGRPVLSDTLFACMETAWLKASVEWGATVITQMDLWCTCLLQQRKYLTLPAPLDALDPSDVVQAYRNSRRASPDASEPAPARAASTELERYTRDLTEVARQGRLDPAVGRDEEIRKLIDVLSRRRKNNPILLGEPGVGKTAVVEGLAQCIVIDAVPKKLRGVTLLALDLGALRAGASVRGEIERRVKALLKEVQTSEKSIVLFIDEVHTIIGGNGTEREIGDLLKPELARGELRVIAATTWMEYKRDIEKDPALERRFQAVRVDEPSLPTALEMVTGVAPLYETTHELTVSPEALEAAVRLSHRYLTSRRLPDKAIDLIDTACARKRIAIDTADERTPTEGGTNPQVDAADIATVLADWTGIPLGRMYASHARAALELPAQLSARVRGQEVAVQAVSNAMVMAASSLLPASVPRAVMLLVGPSGVGKTELATAVAQQFFGDAQALVSVNLSEFQERHMVARLIGAPPGYVGHGEGGMLTEAVRKRPHCVVLLDECEKAHPDVLNLFFQVFDKGILTDGDGRTVRISNTVIFLTSNLGSDEIENFGEAWHALDLEQRVCALQPSLQNHIPAALLGRMSIVPFNCLSTNILADIVRMKLADICRRVLQAHEVELTFAQDVVPALLAAPHVQETGARALEQQLRRRLMPALSRFLLQEEVEGTLPRRVVCSLGGEFWRFDRQAEAS